MAFGSSNNYGPACGKCFKLTLLNSYTGTPPFFPNTHPSVVVKVTDLCPLSANGWCSGTENKTNPYVLVHYGPDPLCTLCPLPWGCGAHGRLTRDAVVGAVNTLISILHTPRLRSQTTSFPRTRHFTDTRHASPLSHLASCHYLIRSPPPTSRTLAFGTSPTHLSRAHSGKVGETMPPKAAHQIYPVAAPLTRPYVSWFLSLGRARSLFLSQGGQTDTCPSYSDANGIPPDTTTSDAQSPWVPSPFSMSFVATAMFSMLFSCLL